METTVKRNTFKLGVFVLLGSALLTSLNQVFYANKVQTIHPFLFTGISFLITSLYFQFFYLRQKVDRQWKVTYKPLLKLNLASIITFMGFYYALKYIEPAIVSSLQMGIGPIFILMILVLQKQSVITTQWIIAVGTLLASMILIWIVLSGNSGVGLLFSIETFLAITGSILCGVGAVLCSVYSKQLNEIGWTSSMILANRFIGIVVVSLILTYDSISPYFQENISWILFVPFFGVLLPMYLLQKGIQYTNTFMVMMSLCFIPVFTFIFQLIDSRIELSLPSLGGITLLFIMGIYSIYVENKKSIHIVN
ncbi:EamA family transporter [Ornithinibacillus sp. 4-3]|uniref:EamA family transporter n=1 Tax=Ornithinibacillus sp. 4-3 TaxID=3231488 RepID=A0AB39HP94_9BACI